MTTSTTGHDTPETLVPVTKLVRSFNTPCVLLDHDGRVLQDNAAARALAPSLWAEGAPADWQEMRGVAPDFPDSVPVRVTAGSSGPEMRLSRIGGNRAHVYLLYATTQDRQFVGLLARTTHDIRTELQTILAANDLLRDPGRLPTGEPQVLHDNIRQAAGRSLELIDAALDLTRGEYGRLDPAHTTFSPSRCIATTVQRMKPLARTTGNEIILDIPETPTSVIGRPDLVETIAQNLLSNAVKYTRNGNINVTVQEALRPDTGTCDFTIVFRDTGIGIPEREQARILLPFQAGELRDADWRSTGIGTFIVQKSLDTLGGTLKLDSTPEEGTCFTVSFTLPLTQDRARAASAGHPLEDDAEGQPVADARLLLVEDNEVNRRLLLQVLRSAGAVVDSATDGAEALARLQSDGPDYDLVLLDLTMSGFDGLALACRLLHTPVARPPRIAALSGQSTPDDGFSYALLGISEIIYKPVRPRDLVRRVGVLLSTPSIAGLNDRPDVLNAALVNELREEMGHETADNLMRRAIDEAQALGDMLSDETTITSPRENIHSALGSSGMTGLGRIEHALRVIQAVSKLRAPGTAAMREALHLLRDAIRVTKGVMP